MRRHLCQAGAGFGYVGSLIERSSHNICGGDLPVQATPFCPTHPQNVFVEEFGTRPSADRPLLTCLVIVDSEASDHDDFTAAMASLSPGVCLVFAVIGFGPPYDYALRYYTGVAENQPRLRVAPLGGLTTAQIADTLLTMSRMHG